ncbi:hypothetical protein RM780_13665 [Streptomyces sp. DSM 44917]|uniref:Uncharacterized protein n=1 Tax=Streptomyces boetiae TaxID=3075541 RepID=A0ABU2L8V5_9ACTN|nr:hypothetical protein [Streptomyces sp. DSM 44917]MDT0308005.1 hypothetical protein [Streptomyces sp. DSM 44917]
MSLSVQLITNRGPFAAEAGVIHIPVAIYGLHRAPELAMADTDITLCPAEVRKLVGELAQLVGWPGQEEGPACRDIEPSRVRVWW